MRRNCETLAPVTGELAKLIELVKPIEVLELKELLGLIRVAI